LKNTPDGSTTMPWLYKLRITVASLPSGTVTTYSKFFLQDSKHISPTIAIAEPSQNLEY